MSDVLITPASKKIEFFDASSNIDGKIELDASDNLVITNAGGDIIVGDSTSDIFVGDGVTSVDIVFEQNGEIRGTGSQTITLGTSGDTIAIGTGLAITGDVNIDNGTNTTVNIISDDTGISLLRAYGAAQGSGAIEVGQSTLYGGGISYNGDSSPAFVTGETSDNITFYRMDNGTRTEVFHYPYNSDVVNFNATPTVSGSTVWHAGNDGTTSGLDADLLDGEQGSSYLRSNDSDTYTGTLTIGSTSGDATIAFPDISTSVVPDAPTNQQYDYMTFGANGSISQVSGRGALMIASSDDSLVLANGDIGRTFTNSEINVGAEETYLLSDGGVQIFTGLQAAGGSGWPNAHSFAFNNSGQLDINVATGTAPLAISSTTVVTNLNADLLDGQQGSYYLNTATNFGGDVSGTYDNIEVTNDSHTHAFNNLTSKTSGTGEYSTSGIIESGRGSGGVALTINDGYGNANVTFNHKSGTPEQNGNSARIESNTDSTSGAALSFELGSNVTASTPVSLTTSLELTETSATFVGDILPDADNTGNVGTTAATWNNGQFTNLTVNGTLSVRAAIDLADSDVLRLGSSDDFLMFYDGTANEVEMEMESACTQIRITDNTTTRFTFAKATGDFTATGEVTAYSDQRLKSDITTIDNGLELVKSMRGVTYTKDDRPGVGVIAQEIEQVLPQVVRENDEGYKSVAYGNVVGVLIEAIKEQQTQIDALKQEIDKLKNA